MIIDITPKRALRNALHEIKKTGKPAQIKLKREKIHNYLLLDENVRHKWICTPRDGFISKNQKFTVTSSWSYYFMLTYIKGK